jgi:hypothetical protein
MLTMTVRWWFTWLGIFYEMMNLKILYHCDLFSRRLHVELIDGSADWGLLPLSPVGVWAGESLRWPVLVNPLFSNLEIGPLKTTSAGLHARC